MNKRRYQTSEKKGRQELGLSKTMGSGSGDIAGDGIDVGFNADVYLENKSTNKQSYRLTKEDWKEWKANATSMGRTLIARIDIDGLILYVVDNTAGINL